MLCDSRSVQKFNKWLDIWYEPWNVWNGLECFWISPLDKMVIDSPPMCIVLFVITVDCCVTSCHLSLLCLSDNVGGL